VRRDLRPPLGELTSNVAWTVSANQGGTSVTPNSGSNHAEKLVGSAVHSSAVAVAMRHLKPVAEYQQAGTVTDPVTGMTFGYLRFTDTRADKVFVTLEFLYGFSPAKTDDLKRVVRP